MESKAKASRRSFTAARQAAADRQLLRTVFLSTALCSWAAHGFLFANEFFSHDSVSYYTYADWGLPFYTRLGRFLIPFYELCKGYVAAPWLIGVLFTLWMSLSAFLVIRLLGIRYRLGQVLSCALLCVNQALILTGATYIYCMDEYALALLLSVCAAYLFQRSGRRRRRPRRGKRLNRRAVLGILAAVASRLGLAAVGVAALIASLSIYQPYFTVTASLCVLSLLRRTGRGERPGPILYDGLRYLAFLAGSFALYFILWTFACAVVGVTKLRLESSLLTEEAAVLTENPQGLWNLLQSANAGYFTGLFRTETALGSVLWAVHGVLLALVLLRLVRLLTDRRLSPCNRLALILLSCLLPTALASISILIPGDDHGLTTYAGELAYLLAVLAMEPASRRRFGPRVRALLAAALCLVVWQHVVFANQVYMKKDLEKNATLVLAAQVVDRIESVEGYVPAKTRVAFVGRLDANPTFSQKREAFGPLSEKVGLWYGYSATYNLGRYLTDYLHYPLRWDQSTAYERLDAVRRMPVYPEEGSVRMVRGTVVVKLSG